MSRLLTGLCLMFLTACATGPQTLAPVADRTKMYNIETGKTKAEAFSKVSEWVARSFENSNETTRLSDKEEGKIVVKGNTKCTVVEMGNGIYSSDFVKFTAVFNITDKRVALEVTDLEAHTTENAWDNGLKPNTKEQADLVFSKCIDSIVPELTTFINK